MEYTLYSILCKYHTRGGWLLGEKMKNQGTGKNRTRGEKKKETLLKNRVKLLKNAPFY